MKNKKLYYFLMFFPLFIVLASLQLLPDKIPAHYGISGEVDRWGSQYETLIFPAITIIFGFIMLIVTKYASKQEKVGNNNQKIGTLTGILSLLLFNRTVPISQSAFQCHDLLFPLRRFQQNKKLKLHPN